MEHAECSNTRGFFGLGIGKQRERRKRFAHLLNTKLIFATLCHMCFNITLCYYLAVILFCPTPVHKQAKSSPMMWNKPLNILVRLFSRRRRHRGVKGRGITFRVDVHLLKLSSTSREHVDDVAAKNDPDQKRSDYDTEVNIRIRRGRRIPR